MTTPEPELYRRSAAELAAGMHAGELSSVELTEALID